MNKIAKSAPICQGVGNGTRSTYSSSLPTGTPRARRVTTSPRALSASPMTWAVVSPSAVKLVASHLLHHAIGGPLQELLHTNVLRTHTIQRRQSPHEHEIQAMKGSGALQRRLVCRGFHHAQPCRIAPGVQAGITDLGLRERMATRAMLHLLCRMRQRLGQHLSAPTVVLQQMKGHAGRRLRPHPRQPPQGLDQRLKGIRCVHEEGVAGYMPSRA